MSDKKKVESKKIFTTGSGIELDPVYTNYPPKLNDRIGLPGEFPFVRGVQKDMYRGRHWTMRQYAGFGSAKESNARYKYLLSQGQMGLSVAFDLPTQLGLDPDHARTKGEVGKVGVSIATLDDMRELFDGIALKDISTSVTINASAGVLLALYIAFAKEQGTAPSDLRGTVQNDLLKEYAARGNYIYPPAGSMKLAIDIIEYCKNELPKWNPISISGYHIREAGSTAVQEIAFTLANAIAYVEGALKRGLDIDDFASRLSFFFNVHNDFLEEIAKFRAARRLWANIVKERFGAKKSQSMMLRFHSQTGGSTLTAQQPDNNIVRVAFQAMASVLGGTQSLHTNGFDEALALPTEKSAKIALRTQQLIAYETGVTNTVDPLAGSYVIENLTDELEKRAQTYLTEIENRGGVIRCIEDGYIQNEISSSAYAAQLRIEREEQIIVGVNRFRESHEEKVSLQRISDTLGTARASQLQRFRAERNGADVDRALKDLESRTRRDENSMPLILNCVEQGATLGEVCDVFRRVFGTHREFTGF